MLWVSLLIFAAAPDAGLSDEQQTLLNKRPYRMVVPARLDGGQDAFPLVVLLHGYGETAIQQDRYFHMSELAHAKGFLLATPNGTPNLLNLRSWNATDACCDVMPGRGPDDVAYLTAILDDVAQKHRVDSSRVFIVGHSNGGFMAHRMACERSDRIAGIVSLAGSNWADANRCKPSQPIAVLEVHGTADKVVPFEGGRIVITSARFPGSVEVMTAWAARLGCAAIPERAGDDLDLILPPGDETDRVKWKDCAHGSAAELWTVKGGIHGPAFTAQWPGAFWDFLVAHPKP